MLDHHRIARSLAGASLGHQIDYHPSLGSTNDHALALGERGYPHGVVVLADTQTEGRGRRGNRWESPPGLNLYLSVLLRPEDLPLAHWPRLTTAIALALCQAIEEEAPGVRAMVKWPNDIYLDGRKVAGILTETGQVGGGRGGDRFAVAGTGINVHAGPDDLPPELRETAISIRSAAPDSVVGREELAIAYLRHLARLLPAVRDGFPGILAEVVDRSWLLGRDITWRAEDGQHAGHALGLDPEGALRVRLPDGSERSLRSVETIRPVA